MSTNHRVNSLMLPQFVGQNVLVVGRVKGDGGIGQMVHLEGPDGGDIVIDRRQASRDYGSPYVEVLGTVNADRTILETRAIDFGQEFDLQMYNETLLTMNGPLKDLF
ncbi:hypothetical protein T484DRAFT_1981311 [Baffinella frigidus]|nr:hypothetical protein T484DRAFT_1981311 [Cryptophyta sp. CCMP2293]|eukprot:CAMPEP_0180137818 /NCGR_PEP_ID=MMETSP0986-20121125/12474_1 /TAXON_ID=697907 /ORGANISM="non described non described, Strain CCMP2293" /LENGTH=106 /DNA_ID=CAMNT_0022079423 /DNA_START=18 /DNA_END=338 /DNA_ORIENTATION=+